MANNLLFFLPLRKIQFFLLISTLLYFFVYDVSSDESVNQIKAHHTSENIVIDGHLSELDWQKADVIDKFVQIEPHEGAYMSYRINVSRLAKCAVRKPHLTLEKDKLR